MPVAPQTTKEVNNYNVRLQSAAVLADVVWRGYYGDS